MNKCCLEYQQADPRICKMVICFRRYQSLTASAAAAEACKKICRTIEYWCLSLRGHCLCCQVIRRKQMKIFLECASWWRWWGQTCSSWLLPGRHLKGFECDRLLLPCRALMGIFAESWMRAGQKILTRPWLIFYGLLVLWANVARWRKIIGPKSGTIIIFCFVLYSVCPYKRRANKSFEEEKAFLLAFRGSSKHLMYAHYSCVHLLSAHSRSLHLLLSQYSWLLLCTICFRVKWFSKMLRKRSK